MTWRANIESDGFGRSARLHLADVTESSLVYISGVDEHGGLTLTQTYERGALLAQAVGIELPVDALHAVLAALARHLGAVEHPEQLRADYMAERARVDKLIAFATGTSRA